MKKFELEAYSLEEAKEMASANGIKVIKNVTQSWKKSASPMSGVKLEAFVQKSMKSSSIDNVEGLGVIMVVNPGSADTRTRPYSVENIVTEGKKAIKRVFEIRLAETNEVVGVADTKSAAQKIAKKLMLEYKQDMYCQIMYEILEGKGRAFNIAYTPSSNAKMGKYLVVGNEKNEI